MNVYTFLHSASTPEVPFFQRLEYAVCYLYDKENSSDFYTMDTHNMCLEALKTHDLKRKEDDWCFERYNCPRFTTPDENGNVILDYALSIVK